MVDRSRSVDVETSMATKKWSTDEFQHVLAIHTEQVFNMDIN
jgi:dynein heavy chain